MRNSSLTFLETGCALLIWPLPGLPRPAISAHIIATNPTPVCPAGRNVYLTKSIKNKKDEEEEDEEEERGGDGTGQATDQNYTVSVGQVLAQRSNAPSSSAVK